jgi:hypothetical protein
MKMLFCLARIVRLERWCDEKVDEYSRIGKWLGNLNKVVVFNRC